MRTAEITRETAETDISLTLDLDGSGIGNINTGCGFLNHMLKLLASHARFDLEIVCNGDTEVDYHHSVEDIGICLGKAIKEALGDKAGISRYGYMILPMDEALILTSVDISGRAQLNCSLDIPSQKIGDFDTELCEEFMAALARSAEIAIHIRQLDGKNSHHIIEGVFKSLARSLRQAGKLDPELCGEIPSTKGAL